MLKAYLYTLGIELLGMAAFIRKKEAFLLCFAANTLTNIPFNLILRLLARRRNFRPSYFGLWPAEVLIILIEALLYRYSLGLPRRQALLISGSLNLLSYLIGFLLFT